MKTDLAKILSVRGQRGLFSYIAQSRNGAIAESLRDHKRTNFAANAGITTLADISIYTLDPRRRRRPHLQGQCRGYQGPLREGRSRL